MELYKMYFSFIFPTDRPNPVCHRSLEGRQTIFFRSAFNFIYRRVGIGDKIPLSTATLIYTNS